MNVPAMRQTIDMMIVSKSILVNYSWLVWERISGQKYVFYSIYANNPYAFVDSNLYYFQELTDANISYWTNGCLFLITTKG